MAAGAQRQNWWHGFEAAHGFVRDSLASLRNLENLLKSTRIGPKALEKVVAEVRPGIRPLGEAFTTLIEFLTQRKPDLSVTCSLKSSVLTRVSELEDAIERAAKGDMGAKSRLQLEAKVVRLGGDLNALRDLVDMLDAATTFLPTELHLNALSKEALAKLTPHTPKHPRVVNVSYIPAPNNDVIITDPRVVMPLVATALGLIASPDKKHIKVTASVDQQEQTLLTCTVPTEKQPTGCSCVVPRIVSPSLDVACSCAKLINADFNFREQERSVCVALSPSSTPQNPVSHVVRL